MSTFDKFIKKISEAADAAFGYADRFSEVARLRFEITKATKRSDNAYEKLGRSYYEHMKKNEDAKTAPENSDFFNFKSDEENTCREIEEAAAEIARLDDLLRKAEVKNLCPVCGTSLGIKTEICRRCGAKVKSKKQP